MELKGKNAIITGASRGIGKAVALKLAKEGVNIVIAARNQQTLDEAVSEIQSQANGKVIGVSTDVSQLDDLKRLHQTAIDELRVMEKIVDTDGQTSKYRVDKRPIEDLEVLGNTNYGGAVWMIGLIIPMMIERKGGSIINMVAGSTLVSPVPRTFVAYSSIKVGLRAFLKGLFWEMRDYGIKIKSILPGVVDTDLTGKLSNITQEQKDRLMSADSVVDMVMFALSVPQNACPLELAVINQQTPWTKPVIDYAQKQAK